MQIWPVKRAQVPTALSCDQAAGIINLISQLFIVMVVMVDGCVKLRVVAGTVWEIVRPESDPIERGSDSEWWLFYHAAFFEEDGRRPWIITYPLTWFGASRDERRKGFFWSECTSCYYASLNIDSSLLVAPCVITRVECCDQSSTNKDVTSHGMNNAHNEIGKLSSHQNQERWTAQRNMN